MDHGKETWISTKERLPDVGDNILIISKFGHISNATYRFYSMSDEFLFAPDGLKPNEDVKWWMLLPVSGWNDINEVQPKEGQIALTMGEYGRVFSGVWKVATGASKSAFSPFVFPVLFWRPMPELPAGVKLNF